MIKIDVTEPGLRITQEITTPSVYLDHWALREISENDSLAGRFSSALKRRDGTLVLSWLNVVEFCKVSDPSQRAKADSLLYSLGWNLFWLDPDFFTVSNREDLVAAGSLPGAPHSDLEFAAFFVRLVMETSAMSQPSGGPPLFYTISARREIQEHYDRLADDIIVKLQEFRTDMGSNKELRKIIKSPPKTQKRTRGTRIIAREFIKRVLKDALIKLDRNNAIDLCHAAVSAAYCDYVLLDKQWAAIVDETRARFAKSCASIPLARVFSKKGSELEYFLQELELISS